MSVELTHIATQLDTIADVASVCQSSNINPWTFYKPVNHQSIKALTQQDFYKVNDGFFLFTFNNPSRMIYELQNPNASNIWTYEDRVAPFRLTDFEEYNTATLDFGLSWVNASSGRVGDILRLGYNFDIYSLLQWNYFEGVRSYVDIVLLIYEAGTVFNAGGTTGVWVYKVMSMVDFDDRINLTIPSQLSNGLYEARLCFSTATSSMSDKECVRYNENSTLFGTWYAMPQQCVVSFSVTSTPPSPSTDFFNYVDFDNFLSCSFDYYSPYIYGLAFRNMVVLDDTHQDFDVYVSYSYTNARYGEVVLGSYSFPLNEGDLYKINDVSYADSIEVMSDAELDDGFISIKIFASITNNATHESQTRTWSKKIERT